MKSGFTVSGKAFRISNIERLISHLEALPFRELQRTRELAAALHISRDDRSLRSAAALERQAHYNGLLLWGSKKTIKTFRREIIKLEESTR